MSALLVGYDGMLTDQQDLTAHSPSVGHVGRAQICTTAPHVDSVAGYALGRVSQCS